MATYKKQLRDKDGNTIYPDVGLDLDNVVYSDDPSENIGDVIDPNSYSTTEKWTGGYWVDGKKIYKRVFTNTFTTPAVGTRLTIELIASNIDNVIRACGNYSPNNSSITTGEHYAFGGGALSGNGPDAEISVRTTNSNKLQLLINNYATAYVGNTGSYSVSVEYTKTS